MERAQIKLIYARDLVSVGVSAATNYPTMASNAMMDVDASVVKVNLENLKLWKSIFRSIKSVVDGAAVSLRIHKAGYVTVNTHDSAHVALLLFKMICDVEGLEEDDVTLVLNSAKLDLKLNIEGATRRCTRLWHAIDKIFSSSRRRQKGVCFQ